MKKRDKKKIIEQKYRRGLIPESLFSEINKDIEQYLEKKAKKKNEALIEEMILARENLGMQVFFSEHQIKSRLSTFFN